ncbi:MAG TPA: hypothetical protein VM286_00640 [Candidatus Thermoplasmatota archaeon]|nr:hypothetical protein [Candidatus Thermoplasmatota archaeon]
MLLRLALRIDGRFLLAVVGLGAAMLVPVAGVLATGGLTPTISKDAGYLALPGPGGDLTLPTKPSPTWVLSAAKGEAAPQKVAFTKGPAVVQVTQAFDGGAAGRIIKVLGHDLITIHPAKAPVGPGFVLVHPSLLPADPAPLALAALYPSKVTVPGAQVQPARGADAFEAQGIADLRSGTLLLVLISTPLVALVAASFARLEAQRWSSLVGIGASLGHPGAGLAVVILRILYLVACATLCCLALALAASAAHLLPGAGSLSLLRLGYALGIPAGVAFAIGSFAAWRLTRDATASLGRSATLGDEPGTRWIPLGLRPLVAGWRLLGMLVLVGLLMGLDVGLPLAAAGSSAALAGQDGEWVIGAREARITGGRVDARPAAVMRLDPAIEEIVAETYVPTLVGGKPVLLRGGAWEDLARYYGLALASGAPPANGTMAVGDALAQRLDLREGQSVLVAGEGGRVARLAVAGTYSGSSLLADEAVLTSADAAALSGLPAGTANVLRVRPQTPAALAAMHRGVAAIQLLDLRVDPATAPAGSIVLARLTAVNLSGTTGTRAMQVRVSGVAVAAATVALGPYESRELRIPLRVPAGDFDVSINPEAVGHGLDAEASLAVPDHALEDARVPVRLLGAPPGARLGLFATLDDALARTAALAVATTDKHGNATLPAVGRGARVVATLQDPLVTAPLFLIAAADAARSRFVVEATYSVPAVPVPGEAALLFARIRNAGGEAGDYTAVFSVDGTAIDRATVHLAAGGQATVSARYLPVRGNARLTVGDSAVQDGGSHSTPAPPVQLPPGQGGASLQARVANSLLGNSRAVLSGLALTAGTAALVLLRFGSRRVLGQRSGVVALLGTMWSAEHVQRRAAQEGAVLGALGGLAGLLLAKLVFLGLSLLSALHPFGHALPDPMTPLLMLQIVTLTGFLASTTLYATAGKSLAGTLR